MISKGRGKSKRVIHQNGNSIKNLGHFFCYPFLLRWRAGVPAGTSHWTSEPKSRNNKRCRREQPTPTRAKTPPPTGLILTYSFTIASTAALMSSLQVSPTAVSYIPRQFWIWLLSQFSLKKYSNKIQNPAQNESTFIFLVLVCISNITCVEPKECV